MKRAGLIAAVLSAVLLADAAQEKADGARVSCQGISGAYARAIARVVAAARAAAVELFALNM